MIMQTAQQGDAGQDVTALERQAGLVKAFPVSGIFDETVGAITVLETHISWVILTGKFAYKIKKAVDFGFLDFSTLEKRRFYCSEELRLNRRFAPGIYLDVVEITGSPEKPARVGAVARPAHSLPLLP